MTPRLPACTARDVERILRRIGFLADRQSGSHRIFVHPTKAQRIVLPMHNRDLKPGLLHQIIKDCGLTAREFHALLRGRR